MLEEKVYYYEIGMKRKEQDLYIRGVANFIIDERDEGIIVLSAQPPWIRVIVSNESEINNVVNRWWNLFVGRFRKMVGGKTIVKPIVFREVRNDEDSERANVSSEFVGTG